ncbi:MAG: hypothetical protein C4555_02795 [Dehalococcoidia bacterium]|jgi:hypothetical protein|nr:MAG: hypothetical protein C4555_02795 [Dehalococcoidia bacterium]
MRSQALQSLVKKIFGDEKTRLEFESNPEGVLSQFDLSKQEKKAVMNTYSKLGLVSGNSQQMEATLKATIDWSAPEP